MQGDPRSNSSRWNRSNNECRTCQCFTFSMRISVASPPCYARTIKLMLWSSLVRRSYKPFVLGIFLEPVKLTFLLNRWKVLQHLRTSGLALSLAYDQVAVDLQTLSYRGDFLEIFWRKLKGSRVEPQKTTFCHTRPHDSWGIRRIHLNTRPQNCPCCVSVIQEFTSCKQTHWCNSSTPSTIKLMFSS